MTVESRSVERGAGRSRQTVQPMLLYEHQRPRGLVMMHQRSQKLFKFSVVALAVVANVSARAYEGTRRVLGFDRNGPQQTKLDEVDLALMDTAETLPLEDHTGAVAQGVRTNPQLTLDPLDRAPEGAPAIATMPAIDPNAIPVATIDYTHIVGPSETMWTIAKVTTGNPNNWRILSEINQLDINTPMQIGQELVIPADLVKPEIVAALIQQQGQNQIQQPMLANESAPQRIIIPENNNFNGEAVATLSDEALTDSTPITDESQLITEAPQTEAPLIDPTLNAVALTAEAGETLWDMAKRTTGDATNWKAIAEHNGFTERDIGRIRYGQTIHVPAALAKIELGGDNYVESVVEALPAEQFDADSDATDTLISTSVEAPAIDTNVNSDAVDATATLVASSSNLMDETQEIKIVEAKFQGDEIQANEVNTALVSNSSSDVIMVSGTYYPKAVYLEADFSSSLLMRVSPGTQMIVSRTMGPWYEVETENGLGYMHSRDIK